ncbi:MAG: hypothetical protein RLZ22_1110, partial [Verrucomicrobiota bacterium]
RELMMIWPLPSVSQTLETAVLRRPVALGEVVDMMGENGTELSGRRGRRVAGLRAGVRHQRKP